MVFPRMTFQTFRILRHNVQAIVLHKRAYLGIILALSCLSFLLFYHSMKSSAKNDKDHADWATSRPSFWSRTKEIIDGNHFLEPMPSCSSPLNLLIIVCSAPKNFAARQAIRSTWGREKTWNNRSEVFFLIGRSSEDLYDRAVSIEQQSYEDIIRYDLMDSYENLTIKSVSLLKWATGYCSHAKYVMKCDDNMFVNIPAILTRVLHPRNAINLVGKVITREMPIRDEHSQWYIPKESYPFRYYPDYLAGSGYVMSQNTTALLYNASRFSLYIYFEDVFITGICAEMSGIERRNDIRFTYTKLSFDPCAYLSRATVHHMSPQELYQLWDIIIHIRIPCVYVFWAELGLDPQGNSAFH